MTELKNKIYVICSKTPKSFMYVWYGDDGYYEDRGWSGNFWDATFFYSLREAENIFKYAHCDLNKNKTEIIEVQMTANFDD